MTVKRQTTMDLHGSFLAALLLLLLAVISTVQALSYDVHWLEGTTTIERDTPSLKQTVDIYCYPGTSKNLLALFQTVKFNIRIKNDEFSQYVGKSPEDVFKDYTEDSYGWSSVISPFQRRAQRTLYLELFTPTCMALSTKQRHSIELQVIRVDIWRVLLMILGVALLQSSKALSGNPVFFYLCGVLIGVFASFMVLIYYVSKLLPRKTLTYGILIGGWTVGVYLFQQVWENLRTLLVSYQTYMFWYTVVVSLVSFFVCYRIGPPRNQRSKNIVMWTLQAVAMTMLFFSSDYREASTALIVISLSVKYFPESLLRLIKGYWFRRFPPKPRLLSNEEYYEQGARETKRALESLRKYCSSPDCAQWSIMLKLNDSRRSLEHSNGATSPNRTVSSPRRSSNTNISSPRQTPITNAINPRTQDTVATDSSRIPVSPQRTDNTSLPRWERDYRFASFVEGNSHLSDDEVLDYESYAFSLDAARKPDPATRSSLEISDDNSSDEDL